MWIYIVCSFVTLIAIVLGVQGIRCAVLRNRKVESLSLYEAKVEDLSYGKMSYVLKGEGEVILSVHGIFGGYDQAYETCKDFVSTNTILAPSRFGYLGSDVKGKGTPKEQAEAYAELLDKLGIDKVYVLSTSAGGSVALRFALDYPDRVKGLIMYCSAMPLAERPTSCADYAGPPSFMVNDYAMFLLSPLFEPIMGMEPSTINDMFPIDQRKAGVEIDSSITNLDMARNYDDYHVEDLSMPVLVLHSKDDKLANYAETEKAVTRFSNCTFISFEDGGHLMKGHEEEVINAVVAFIESNFVVISDN